MRTCFINNFGLNCSVSKEENQDSYPLKGGFNENVKSDKVHAPIIEEFPVVMEYELLEFLDSEYVSGIVGKTVNVKAEESVLSENGNVGPAKVNALIFDQFQHGYYVTGEKVGQAWNAGASLMKK